MRSNRVHLPGALEAGALLTLPDGASRHVVRVLRLRPGDPLVVFDGRGAEHEASVETATGRGVEIRVGAPRETIPEPALKIELAQGISRAERMDLVVQKAVELGVSAIRPLATARTVVRLDARRAATRLAHWQAVAGAACEQSGRATVPEIHPIVGYDPWLGARQPEGTALILDPRTGCSPFDLPAPEGSLTLLIGPEGGLAPPESDAARRAGFTPVRLGPRILRTETAALVALTTAQLLWGDLKPGHP